MTEKELIAQEVTVKDEGSAERSRSITLWQAVTMSIVAIIAVAVGTVYGTILF